MGPSWLSELLYQGASGVGLTSNVSMNQLANEYYTSTDLTLLNKVYSASQNYRPFTQFGTISYLRNAGHNSYHAFTARIEKRYASDGLTLNAHYTLSKSLSGTVGDGWQHYNWSLTKAPSGDHHRIVMQAMYDLPVGKGRRFLTEGGWLNHVIGGWNLLVVAGPTSGSYTTFSFSGSPSRYLSGGPSRPNQLVSNDQVKVADWSMGEHRFPVSAQNPMFNIKAFAYPAAFTHGSLGAGTVQGLWTFPNQWSISKFWMAAERYKFVIRLDGNNIPVRFVGSSGDSTVNLTSPETFGKFGIQSGMSFSTMGQSNGQLIISGRFEF
jgi:hypothetical protein